MAKKNTDNETLRSYGYMTTEEFMDCLIPGLTEYLETNWGRLGDLHHPEDLFSTASIYIEVARHMAGSFIVAPKIP